MYDNTSNESSKILKTDKKNIYQQLAELPEEIADDITSSKTDGGRALNAVWALNISSNHKIILLYLGSQIDFRGKFENKYAYHSIAKIAKCTGISRKTVERVLNGCQNQKQNFKKMGLIEMGLVLKQVASKSDQIKENCANHYALTSLLFNNYMEKMIPNKMKKFKEAKEGVRQNDAGGYVKMTQGVRQNDAGGYVKMTHTSPSSYNSFSNPVCVEERKKQPKSTHTQISEKTKQDLARVLNDRLNRTFSDSNDCAEIIDIVMKEKLITVDKFKEHMQDIQSYDTKDVFNVKMISTNKSSNLPLHVKEIANNLCNWIENKEMLKLKNEELLKKKAEEEQRQAVERKKVIEQEEYLLSEAATAERIRIAQEAREKFFASPIFTDNGVKNDKNSPNLNLKRKDDRISMSGDKSLTMGF